jgi:hypothetical protein
LLSLRPRFEHKVQGCSSCSPEAAKAPLSIVAHEQYAQSHDPVFEIVDGRRMLSYWARVFVTPRQATVLLEERGGPPEEERGNPHERG